MHGVLVLPLVAWLLSLTDWSELQRLKAIRLAIAGYVILVGGVAVVNLLSL